MASKGGQCSVERCGVWRTRLYTCAICSKKLCGCCSIKSSINGARLCCYPGDAECVAVNRKKVQEAVHVR